MNPRPTAKSPMNLAAPTACWYSNLIFVCVNDCLSDLFFRIGRGLPEFLLSCQFLSCTFFELAFTHLPDFISIQMQSPGLPGLSNICKK
jgi:hypothetical protein